VPNWSINGVPFPFRRKLQITTSSEYEGVSVGHPITIKLSSSLIDMNKILPDFTDLVTTYNGLQIPRRVTQTDAEIDVEFQVQSLLNANQVYTDSYYIYYGNPLSSLIQLPYIANDWPVSVTADGLRVSYTNPGEDWTDGISNSRHAKAILSFNGTKVRLISNKADDYGIAEIQLDEGAWTKVDLYSQQDQSNVVVYENDSLVPGDHALRIRATGTRNAGSTNNRINIVRFDYMKNVQAIDLGEEVDDFTWSSSLGGV
jgi:hypothetical protein